MSAAALSAAALSAAALSAAALSAAALSAAALSAAILSAAAWAAAAAAAAEPPAFSPTIVELAAITVTPLARIFPALFNKISPVPALNTLPSTTVSAPLCVMLPLPLMAVRSPPTVLVPRLRSPALLRVRLPVVVTAPSIMALASFSTTSLPPSTLTVPTKSFALSSVMSSPAFRSVGPALTVKVLLAPWLMSPKVACNSRLATLTTPSSVMSVAAVTSSLPVVVTPPSVMLLTSFSVTSLLPSTFTVPTKSFALSSVMSSPALRSVGPALTVKVPAV